ncbi:uncharacterized protein OCT59_018905 [Rhizophagus irregularis]|uniref:uncharacterized protein n=1 Tax=Rhizophagus irregularis TaxID=588596 RepID=UPI0033295DA9|nr:hypothetical protein OCT59_018905 [Rhizophagus irregularis]
MEPFLTLPILLFLGLLAYLTVEKKGTFDALDLEFGNGNVTNVSIIFFFVVLSTYSILEETEWFKNIRYTIESVPNSNFETRILEIVGNRQNNWIDQSMIKQRSFSAVGDTGKVSDREYAGNAYNVSNPECVGNS